MGIVAVCPNGHRVKVKDSLAGRKGICPTCAARFRIPRKESLPNDEAAAVLAADVAAPPVARVVSLDPLYAASLPAARPIADADTIDAVEAVRPRRRGADRPVAAVDDDPPVEAAAAAPAHPVLDERPDLAWCIAIRGGAASAPLDAAGVRDWLASGAASADHVVWRSDWPDWRPLAEVFPEALPERTDRWP